MPDDPRDRRRERDPLHGRGRAPSSPHALDDSGEINPPPIPNVSDLGGDTPIADVFRRIEERVGRMTERDREIFEVFFDHLNRGRKRQADQLAAVNETARHGGIDVEELRRRMAVDISNWQPFKGDRERLEALEKAEADRSALIGRLKKWIAGSWFIAAVTLGGGLIDYGRRQASGDSVRAQAAADRQALLEQTAKNHAQDIELGVLKALVRTLERKPRRDGD